MSHNTQIFSRWALALPLAIMFSGCMATDADTVSDPVVEFPSWGTDHNQTQSVKVTPAAGWTVSRVDYSLDGTNWMQAEPTDPPTDSYSVALTNLDIGSNDLMLRVTSSYRDQTSTTIFHSPINGIAAVFSCAASSMLPSNGLINNNGMEVRTLVGYFGDPALHTVTATISYNDVVGNAYKNVGSITNYGRNSVTAEFLVDRATCDTGPTNNKHDCDVTYGLTVLVDGASVGPDCPAFGQIHTYWQARYYY